MGLRGFQGQVRREAREKLDARKRPRLLPWNKRGLSRIAKVIAFLEFLPITKGKLTGSKLKILPAQRAFIATSTTRPAAQSLTLTSGASSVRP